MIILLDKTKEHFFLWLKKDSALKGYINTCILSEVLLTFVQSIFQKNPKPQNLQILSHFFNMKGENR